MSGEFEPKILGFLCDWCSYADADLGGGGTLQYSPNIRVLRVMCSARVNPVFILKALTRGVDGVLITGCHPGDCHYRKGNYYTRRRITAIKRLLETLGIEPDRVRLEWVSASEGIRFADAVREFTERIKKLGPNPLKGI